MKARFFGTALRTGMAAGDPFHGHQPGLPGHLPCRLRAASFGIVSLLALILVLFLAPPVPPVRAGESSAFQFVANEMIAMRDGVKLAANLFLPRVEDPVPTILIRTPYGKMDENFGDGHRYTEAGYAVVIQDCRGRGQSEGIWDPFRYDAADGYDTQTWVGRQTWSNGEIGTAGGSYVGWTQWASAPLANPHLRVMAPMVPFSDAYHEIAYPGGAMQLALLMGWGALVGGLQIEPDSIPEALRFLPLNQWDSQFDGEVFYLHDWVEHSTYDDYWRARGIDGTYSDIEVPILNIGGWYDIFSKATLEMADRVRHHAKHHATRRNICTIIGPWGHGAGVRQIGQLDFGPDAALNLQKYQQQWFDYWLHDADTGVEDWPPLYLFIMGENRWRAENEWPLARTQWTKFFLHSRGIAQDLDGDGSLEPAEPAESQPDSFLYDPKNPVPTRGGNNLFGAAAGPFDQREVEERPDVLVYTSPTLNHAVEVTGPVRLILYAASTAPDTDFTAKLVDVYPDGRAMNLCDGIQRARFRESDTNPSLIKPDKIYRYEIDLWVTSNVFLPGHQIRLEVSSSNFPRFDRNPNSGLPFGTDTKLHTATQTIYHDPDHSSHLVLPVIPR